MVVLGGRGSIDSKGKQRMNKFPFQNEFVPILGEEDALGFEVWNPSLDEWMTKPEWKMAKGRYRSARITLHANQV